MKKALLNRRRISVAVASAIAAATLPSVASAQSDSATVEEVIVTGTRLRNSNVTSATPLVQIGAQEIDDRGVARVEDVVNILPERIRLANIRGCERCKRHFNPESSGSWFHPNVSPH